MLINGKLSTTTKLSVDMIIKANDGIIKSKYDKADIEFALKHLVDNEGILSKEKIKKVVAVKLLNEKPDGFRLGEFVIALKQAYELAIPASVESQD